MAWHPFKQAAVLKISNKSQNQDRGHMVAIEKMYIYLPVTNVQAFESRAVCEKTGQTIPQPTLLAMHLRSQ